MVTAAANDSDQRSDLWGTEWDFLAVDSVGHVALLASAGYGPTPEQVIAAREYFERAVARLDRLPLATSAVPVETDRGGDYSDWFAVSARGLYAYDWRMGQAPYELIAVPAEPIRIEELPDEVRGAAGILRVSRPFAEALTLQLG